jgi:hypothetical protein
MNYPDEDYVRFYTRDTITWLALEYEGQAVMSLMLHGRFNRSGVFDCGGHQPSHAVTLATRCPPEVARIGLERLVATKTWVINDGQIIWPNYVYAQHCRRSDRARKRESREKTASDAMGHQSPPVTSGHLRSPPVTPKPKPKQKPKQKPKPKGREQTPPPQVSDPATSAPVAPDEIDRSAPPPPPPMTLQEKSALWLRNPSDASYVAPAPHQWPEVIELDDRIAQVFGHRRRLKIPHNGDPRVKLPMLLWAAGIEQQDLLDAIEGAAQDKYTREHPHQQTATWIFENADRVQELMRKAPKPAQMKPPVRPVARKPDPDEEALAARTKQRLASVMASATPEEIARAESAARAVADATQDLFRPVDK